MEKSTGTKETGINRTKLRSKIWEMFRTKDKAMIKLAQRLCSANNIRYYVRIERMLTLIDPGAKGLFTIRYINRPVEYGLYKIHDDDPRAKIYGIWRRKKNRKRK